MGVSASCERRLEVRALEWRRFGFGIADSFQAFSLAVRPQPEIAINFTFSSCCGDRPALSTAHRPGFDRNRRFRYCDSVHS